MRQHLLLKQNLHRKFKHTELTKIKGSVFTDPFILVHPARFELATPGSEDQCSNPLSYGCMSVCKEPLQISTSVKKAVAYVNLCDLSNG